MTKFHEATRATFQPVAPELAAQLVEFASRARIGKTVTIDGKTYTLDHISQTSSAFFRSRGLSIYYRTGRSIVRISDHWSRVKGYDRSRKFNCGFISSCFWTIDKTARAYAESKYSGRFCRQMIAGKCALSKFQPI